MHTSDRENRATSHDPMAQAADRAVIDLSSSSDEDDGGAPAFAPTRPDSLLWGLDPLFSVPVRLIARHLAALPSATADGDVCWLFDHPVRHVDVMGTVISVDPRNPLPDERRVSFTLDDGTGLVECVQWRPVSVGLPLRAGGQY